MSPDPRRNEGGRWRQSSLVRRLLPLVLVGVLPWTVVVTGRSITSVTFVTAWGLVNPDPIAFFSMAEYFSQPGLRYASLPASLQAWPVATGLYLLGVGAVVVGVVGGPEDRRVTAGLFALAGVQSLAVAVGFFTRGVPLAVPVGTILLWAVAAVTYRAHRARTAPATTTEKW